MSPKLKTLSGKEVVKILEKFGFQVERQRGSHVKMSRLSPSGEKQILTIPLHKELDKGTLRAIFRQACRYVPEDQLVSYFYTS